MKSEATSAGPRAIKFMRGNVHRSVAFVAFQVEQNGDLVSSERSFTVPDAARRAHNLRADLGARAVQSHPARHSKYRQSAQSCSCKST